MCSLKLGISRCALAPQRHGAGFIPILHTSSNESFLLVKIGRGNGLKQCIRSFPFTELTLHPKHPQIRRHASKVHSVFSSSNERNDQLSNSDGVSEDSWPASTGSPPHHPPGEAEPRQQRPGFLRRIALSVLSIIAGESDQIYLFF